MSATDFRGAVSYRGLMSTTTLPLTDFLLARIAEDEEIARAVLDGDDYSVSGRALMEHVARHDPARVLAECEAKGLIVELHSGTTDALWYGVRMPDDGMGCRTCGEVGEYAVPWPCATVRALAAVYAEHPDYRNEWAG